MFLTFAETLHTFIYMEDLLTRFELSADNTARKKLLLKKIASMTLVFCTKFENFQTNNRFLNHKKLFMLNPLMKKTLGALSVQSFGIGNQVTFSADYLFTNPIFEK